MKVREHMFRPHYELSDGSIRYSNGRIPVLGLPKDGSGTKLAIDNLLPSKSKRKYEKADTQFIHR